MGCFNLTCFASQQTIAPGDKCQVLPILQERGYRPVEGTYGSKPFELYGIASSTCYPHAYWAPYGGFIEAEYDDYGQVTLLDTPTNRLRLCDLFSQLQSDAVTVSEGENQCHDVPYDFAAFLAAETPGLLAYLSARGRVPTTSEFFGELEAAWNYVWERHQEHRLVGVDYSDVLRPLQFAIMHQASFDALVSKVNQLRTWRDESLAQRDVFEAMMAKTLDKLPGEGQLREAVTDFLWFQLERELERIGQFEGLTYPGESAVLADAVAEFLLKKLDREGLFQALKPLLDARYVMSGLNMLNLRITPIVTASQDYSNEIGAAYAQFIASVSAVVTQGRRDHYGEEALDEEEADA